MATSFNKQWPCIICTYLNQHHRKKCELCLTPKLVIVESTKQSIPKPPISNKKQIVKSLTPKPKKRNKKRIKLERSKSNISNNSNKKSKSRTLSNFFFSNNSKISKKEAIKLSLKHSKSNELKIENNLAKVVSHSKLFPTDNKLNISISLPRPIMLYKLPANTNISSISNVNNRQSIGCSIYYKELKYKINNEINIFHSIKEQECIQKHESILLEILKCDINNEKNYSIVIDTIINARCDVLCNFLPLIAFTVCEYETNTHKNDWKNKMITSLYDRIIGQSDLRQALTYFIHSYNDIDNVSFIFNNFLNINCNNCIEFWNKLVNKKQIKENDSFDIESNTIIRDPFNRLSSPIKRIIIRKIINSNSKPLLIDAYCDYGLSSTFILKNGDDLRKDKGCMLIFKWINHLFTNSKNYKLNNCKILTYNVIPMGKNMGAIQLIKSVIPLRDVSKLKSKSNISNKLLSNLISTAAGSVIASYILSVRDRHFDNILIRTTDFTMFHIDYCFILGDQLKGLDASLFGITKQFHQLLGEDNYTKFIDLSCNVFLELRHNYKQFINFACLSFSYVFPYQIITKHIYKKLRMNESDQKAIQWLKIQLQEAPFDVQTQIKNKIHKFATR